LGELSDNDLDNEESQPRAPKSDVAAILAAAAATANFESTESTNKRKKQAAEEQKQQEEEIAAAEANSAPMVIGATMTGYAMVTQNGKQKMKFTPPIYLAPLERRKLRTQKKLVPLIEPDICNYIHIDFLPRTMLRLNGDTLDVSLHDVQQRLANMANLATQQASQNVNETDKGNHEVNEPNASHIAEVPQTGDANESKVTENGDN
jgi:hypothetical protein